MLSLRDDRAADQIDHFVYCRHDRNIDIAPLDLRPFVPDLSSQARRVLLEGLMEDSQDHHPAFAPRSRFRQLLEEMNVRPIGLRALEELPHLV
ncbi:MAG: hypothetical protein OXH99_25600 [Bryobacterales bacterium]|nr:hypothetical protein [Bryobacterales bacterium]